ncbi:MAG: helix-turn-helix domain-containing protein, partial [Candidatus Latescibacterota bacterium]
MVDNFDTNVARRKPNTAEKFRPVHPWDVPINPPVSDSLAEESVPSPSPFPFSPPEEPPFIPDDALLPPPSTDREPPPPGRRTKRPLPKNATPPPAAPAREEAKPSVSPKRDSLSDSINIHSNYCKLDNDISDYLLPKLSPSAQCVYLRLYRQSYGWNRNWAAESLPKLTEYCNLSLQTVRKAIKELEVFGCIRKEFSDYHKATVYRIFLPSDIGMGKSATANNTLAYSRGLIINTQDQPGSSLQGQLFDDSRESGQIPVPDSFHPGEYQILEGDGVDFRGQNIFIQSVFFRGTSVSNILESGGSLPKNILTYMDDKHLSQAVDIIDEFYDSIGFS